MQEGRQRSAFIAGVTLGNGIANIVHRRLREHSDKKLVTQHNPFVPVKLLEPIVQTDASNLALGADIRFEVPRGSNAIVVSWPLEGGHRE
ncbi:MAG: hypothetical protein Q7S17_01510 [Xanthobacteraceae bacterium]|nr:hypothetical protein [Xanthobacteraceae bacterium]